MEADDRDDARRAMLERIEELFAATASETGASALDPRVRAALERVPRHRFVPEDRIESAYADAALPLGQGQTISQPFIVALMTQLAEVSADSRVLEVGAGSGYQAAVLAQIARQVYAVEILPELARSAAGRLAALGYANVSLRCADGFEGWKEEAPFDAILVAAAARQVPPALVEQLGPGGRLVVPVGEPGQAQELLVLRRRADGAVETLHTLPVAFVPLTRAG